MEQPRAAKRQASPGAFILPGVLSLGILIAVILRASKFSFWEMALLIAAAVEFWMFLYLVAFTRRISVTTTHVYIDYTFTRLEVPRSRVRGVEVSESMLAGWLIIRDSGGERRVNVPPIFRGARGNVSAAVERLHREASELSDMLKSVPSAPNNGIPSRTLRILNVIVACAAGAVLAFLLGYAVRHGHQG